MSNARQSFARLVGTRRNSSPRDIAAWLVAPFILVVIIPANEKIASNAVFFAAHSVSPLAWIVVLAIFLVGLWLLLIAILTLVRRRTRPQTFDVVASLLMFATTWFLAGNLGSRLLSASSPLIGPVIGLVVAALLTQLSRRIMMGTVLVVFAAIAAVFPVVMGLTIGSDASAAELAFEETTSRPNIVWVISDELQYPLAFDEQGKVRKELPTLRNCRSRQPPIPMRTRRRITPTTRCRHSSPGSRMWQVQEPRGWRRCAVASASCRVWRLSTRW